MIELEKLDQMQTELYRYDVIDGGWEGDPAGQNLSQSINANLTHVGFHLSDVIDRKDFSKPETIEDEIAPDSMQYALRFARWCGVGLNEIIPRPEPYGNFDVAQVMQIIEAPRNPGRIAFNSFIRANGILARQLHAEDHVRTVEQAELDRAKNIRDVSALLVQSACVQAEWLGLDLQYAFQARIDFLRDRFNVPDSRVQS